MTFYAINFLGSIVLPSQSLLCVLFFSSLVNLTGSFAEEELIIYIYLLLTSIHFVILSGLLNPNSALSESKE